MSKAAYRSDFREKHWNGLQRGFDEILYLLTYLLLDRSRYRRAC